MIYRIRKKDKTLRGKISLTPSKSISNRVLIIGALCADDFHVSNLATANDTVLLQKLLDSSSQVLDSEDSGTTFRFLTAYLSQKPGEWLLTGTDRMKQRPIGFLVDALRKLGAEIQYEEKENFPPLRIFGKKLSGGEVALNGSVSSQYISALLLIAPTLEKGLKIKVEKEVFSQSYIEMTLKLMGEFGIEYEWNENIISVKEQPYQSKDITVEADWSAASYWYEMAALSDDVDLTLVGLGKKSVQGDAVIAEMMKQFGVETEYTNEGIRLFRKPFPLLEKFVYDFQSCPDLVQTMAVTCVARETEGEFTGVKNLRIKETDRLVALQDELKRLGIQTAISDSGFQISDLKLQVPTSSFQTHNDHRMAMALAPLALKFEKIQIENPEVVKKSYPEFWDDLRRADFEIVEI